MIASDCRFCFLINFIVFHPFKICDTASDEIAVEPYEEVVGNPHILLLADLLAQ